MLTYDLLAAYAAVAGWFFWLGTRNKATIMQNLIVSLFWPIALVLLLALLLWADGDDNIPDDA